MNKNNMADLEKIRDRATEILQKISPERPVVRASTFLGLPERQTFHSSSEKYRDRAIKLLEDCQRATSWSLSELETYLVFFNLLNTGFEAGFELGSPPTASTETGTMGALAADKPCVWQCWEETLVCENKCFEDEGGSTLCYLECHLIKTACYLDCFVDISI